jgi:hypothetical protein
MNVDLAVPELARAFVGEVIQHARAAAQPHPDFL